MTAIFHLITQTADRGCEMMYVFLRLLQKMKSQAKGASSAYSWQSAYCIYRFFKQF
jgi:hypothetical protein